MSETKSRKEPFGRPQIYNSELAEYVLDMVATHPYGIRKLCAMFDKMPDHTTIASWRHKNLENFSSRYLEARQTQAHLLFEEAIDIADETQDFAMEDKNGLMVVDSGIVATQKMRMHARVHQAARILPQYYDSKQQIDSNASDASVEHIAKRVAEINQQSEKEF
jgi:hypothetical protein